MAIFDSFQRAIATIPRRRRLLLGLGVQAAIPFASLYAALLLRLDLDASRIDHSIYWIWAVVLVLLRLAALVQFRAHAGLWRYVSVPDLLGIAKATTASTIVLIPLLWLVSDFEGIPRTVPLIEWGVHIFLAGGLRMIVRVGRERLKASGQSDRYRTRVLIVGAGDAGAAFCGQVLSTPDFLIEPIAFVDDDLAKIGQSLSGIPVLGTSDQIPSVVKRMSIDMVVIAVPSATPEQRAQIVEYAREARVDFRILPGTDELLTGNVSISKLRRVDVSDLLGRPETQLDDQALRATFTGKTVMITGGAGTIGSELARRVIAFGPSKLILVDRAENPLVLLEYELRALLDTDPDSGLELITRIADVTSTESMGQITRAHRVDVVLHAAAHKHVYLMEDAPADAVINNVGGVLTVARAARDCGATTFVLVSTDKAVAPTSVMGATKRLAELAITELGRDNSTHFAAVRFGNVLGSNASVVPIFQQQIENGGPVTVTHPDAERYFMTAYEAAGLILMAATIGNNREIYLLDMGEPVNIDSLARTMIELSGMVPDQDIEIRYTGLKTGEKLTEILSAEEELLEQTSHPKLLRVMNPAGDDLGLARIDEFVASVEALDPAAVKQGIAKLVTDFTVSEDR
ncbi:MAG: nucleoside-diphosphate sugar epimerase/dehydratase [Dehalococcoidia bacterium]|nr:nucleoside-diphosphate sugar epimerase/dehydratase [Dehalococcoidia bacterium]